MCVLYFHGHNLVFKKLLNLQLHNKTIIGFGFQMIAKLPRPQFVLSASAFKALADNTNLDLDNSHYYLVKMFLCFDLIGLNSPANSG